VSELLETSYDIVQDGSTFAIVIQSEDSESETSISQIQTLFRNIYYKNTIETALDTTKEITWAIESDSSVLASAVSDYGMDFDALPVTPKILTLDGVSTWLSHAQISLTGSGDSLSFEFARNGDFASDSYLADGSEGTGTETNFYVNTTGLVVFENSTCELTLNGAVTAISDISSYLDGEFVLAKLTHNGGAAMGVQRYGANHAGLHFGNFSIRNVSITKGGLTTTWALTSGSIGAEVPTLDELGLGNMTLNNVTAGDYS